MRVVIAETLRRHLTNVGYLIFVLCGAAIAAMISVLGGPAAAWQRAMGFLALVLGAQLIGPEFSSGTLQLILAKPINRSAYLLARVIGVTLVVWIAIWVPFAVDAGGRLIGDAPPNWPMLFGSTINVSLAVALTCTLLALLGSMTRSYLNVALYIILQMVLGIVIGAVNMIAGGSFDRLKALGQFLRDHPIVARGLEAIDRNVYASPPDAFDRDWALMVVSNAAVAIVLACLLFRKREVPYGAD